MTTEKKSRFTVISNNEPVSKSLPDIHTDSGFQTNPIYEKLLNFRNLQEQQKKRFSIEELLKW